ncbi:hypothetical protein MAR_032611, partial [Mya arenaria]
MFSVELKGGDICLPCLCKLCSTIIELSSTIRQMILSYEATEILKELRKKHYEESDRKQGMIFNPSTGKTTLENCQQN